MVNLKKTATVDGLRSQASSSNVRHLPAVSAPCGPDQEQAMLMALETLLGKSLRTVRFVPEDICRDAMAKAAAETGAAPNELARIVRDLVRNKDEIAVRAYITDQLQKKVEVARHQATLHGHKTLGSRAIYRKQLDDLRGDVRGRYGQNPSDIDKFIEEGLRGSAIRVTELPWPASQATDEPKPGFFARLFGKRE